MIRRGLYRATGRMIVIGLGVLCAGVVVARDVPFGVGQTLSSQVRAAKAVAIGDIDGDGDMDLVGGGDQRFQLGLVWFEHDGRFPPGFTQRNISTNVGSVFALDIRDVAIADMDGDGDVDVVAGSAITGLDLYLNLGGIPPRWSLQIIRQTRTVNNDIEIVDMDGDDDPDIVTCSIDDGVVAWWENSGGTPVAFTERVIATDLPGCRAVDVVDVDGNGTLDVVAGGHTADPGTGEVLASKLAWYANDGATPPGWTPAVITEDSGTGSSFSDGIVSLQAGDLDLDGDLDVAVASRADDRIAWYENDGGSPPTFVPEAILSDPDGAGPLEGEVDEPTRLALVDPDGDGDLDIAVTGEGLDHLGWIENDGMIDPAFVHRTLAQDPDGPLVLDPVPKSGPFPLPQCPSQPSDFLDLVDGEQTGILQAPSDIVAGDIDGDGDVDLATASSGDGKIAWHENRSCDAVFPFQPPVADGTTDGAASTAIADLDGDGDLDVVTASSLAGRVEWHENDGELMPAFTLRIVGASLAGAQSVDVADVNGDGNPDVLVAAPRAGILAWYENDGASPPTFAQRLISTTTPAPRAIHGADIDGDGDVDVVSASSGDNAVTLWTNVGGATPAWESEVISRNGLAPWAVDSADLNQDGARDILYAALANGRIAWLRNDGPDGFTELPIAPGSNSDPGTDAVGIARAAIDVTVGDFNGDGAPDVASVSAFDDKVAWYRSSGGAFPQFTEIVIAEDPDGPTDLNVLFQSVGACPVAPAVTVIEPVSVTISNAANGVVNGASGIEAADLDGDGDVDLAVTGALDSSVAWFANNGIPAVTRFQYRRVSGDAVGARAVSIGDLNGDGRPDLVSGAYRDDTVDWYLGADDDACIAFDANGDGALDASELVLMGRAFGLEQSPQDDAVAERWWREADLNDDGRIDGEDLSALGSTGVWGASVFTCHLSCPAAAD